MPPSGPGILRPAVHAQDHTRGAAAAPVTLLEYGDFECPDCAEANAVVEGVRQRVGGALRFVFRNFPLVRAHPHALHAAEAAESVAAHAGSAAYWAMYDALFAHGRRSARALDDDHLVRYAAAASADGERVRAELGAGTHEARVRADYTSGTWSGVSGAPTFFVNGVRFDGDWRDVTALAWTLERVAHSDRQAQAFGSSP